MAKKSFLVEDKTYDVRGLSEEDSYLQSIMGRFEPKFQRFCSTMPSDAVALDIGANIGVTSIILGHYLSEGRIFALEPGKTIFSLLEENLEASQLQQVVPLNCAVSNQTGFLRFIEASAYGHLAAGAAPGSEHDACAVRACTLDDLVDELKLQRLDLIKVDVEGFEPQVFEGARKALARFNPIVYFELNSWCLIAHGAHNPIEFMRQIIGDFRHVFRVSRDADSDMVLERVVTVDLALTLIHDNIARHGSVDDIVVVNDESRLNPQLFVDPPDAGERLSIPQETLLVERDQLRPQLDPALNSSWRRYTRFLRKRGPRG